MTSEQIVTVFPTRVGVYRLAGDPTLGGTVDTIVFPVSFAVSAVQWNTIPTQMISFTIPVKYRESPIT